ncbi:MAG TPA: hypothetical protein VGK99_04130 [Acidobacteriota bacterium]
MLVSLLLASIAFLAYSNSFPGAFHFDDYPLLLDNPAVTGKSFPYLTFLQHYGGRPLTLWSFYWNYRLFGSDPLSYHLISVALHAIAVVCLFLLVSRLFSSRFLACGTALIFALHPLQTQPVNYVWSRSMLIMSCFGLLSLLLVRKHPVAALICWQLAIWSRSEAIVLAVFLLWIRPERWKSAAGLALLNAGAFLYGLAAYRPPDFAWNYPDAGGYFLQQGQSFWRYASLVIWPGKLTVDHHFTFLPSWVALAGIVSLLSVSCFIYRFRNYVPVPVAGWFWFIVLLLPSLMIPNKDFINESRIYLALPGLALIAVWFFERVGSARKLISVRTLGLCLIGAAMLGFTWQRNKVWTDDVSLWRDAVSKGASKWRTHYNLGAALARQGSAAEAEREFHIARLLNGGDDFSLAGLGYCAELRSDWTASRRFYVDALKLNPSNHYARKRLDLLNH